MQLDRDLGVAVVRAAFPRVDPTRQGWDMLAATGVRGLRLLHETGAFGGLLLTERDPDALRVLTQNAAAYQREGARVQCLDARRPIGETGFAYVDLDPFGTPAPFLDSALSALAPGGLLAVTATDLPVLTGVSRGVCESRYGARPIRGSRGNEGGLRIVMAFVAHRAAAFGRRLHPVLAYVHDHYVRCYTRIEPRASTESIGSEVSFVPGPGWAGPSLPPGPPYGPLWIGPLFDADLVGRLAPPPTAERPEFVRPLIERLQEEAEADTPFYYEPNQLAAEFRLPEPPSLTSLLAPLRARGFRAARSHVRPSAFRTTAPRTLVEAIARTAARTER